MQAQPQPLPSEAGQPGEHPAWEKAASEWGVSKEAINARRVVLGAVLLMLALKAGLLIASRVPFNADEAVVALMARHILGGARPVFFYGQAYMGSLDAYLVAGGFTIFGQHVWVIRLVQALLYAGTLLTTARLGRLIFGSEWAGALAVLLLAIPTVNVTLYTTVSLGGYGEALLIGNLILLTSLCLRKRIEIGEQAPGLWLGWGFLAGLGLWAFGLTLIYTLPAGIYLLVWLVRAGQKPAAHGRSLLAGRSLLVALAGFGMGAAPWLVYAVQHGPEALLGELGGSAIAAAEQLPWIKEVFQHILNFSLLGITALFGLRPPWSPDLLAWPLLPLALIFWMWVTGTIVLAVRKPDAARPERRLLAGVGVTLILAFLFTPFGADPSGRYFVPLAVPLALFAGAALVQLAGRPVPAAGRPVPAAGRPVPTAGRPVPAAGGSRWLALAVLMVALGFNLWGTVECALRYPPGITTQFYPPTQIDHRDDARLMEFLHAQGETTGYTNYWVAYPLAFLSQETLIFSPGLPYHLDLRQTTRDDRYPAYTARVAAAKRTAYITTHNPALDERLTAGFTRLGLTWQEAQIGDYHVFYGLPRPVHPAELEIAGAIGSTDHHSAHPGSYGHGRAGVWAAALTRDGIWEAIQARRTYALTGDRIALAYTLNGEPMGALLPMAAERRIEIAVEGGDALDTIELLHNNRVLQRWSIPDADPDGGWHGRCKLSLELGWDDKNRDVDWEVGLEIVGGALIGIEPRFRGRDIVAPQTAVALGMGEEARHAFSQWERSGENGVVFKTRTWGNPTTTTANTQAMSLEIVGSTSTQIKARINEQKIVVSLGELLVYARAGYTSGYRTPAYRFSRAASRAEYAWQGSFTHQVQASGRDWYTVRVRQKNGQMAWGSPIWVDD